VDTSGGRGFQKNIPLNLNVGGRTRNRGFANQSAGDSGPNNNGPEVESERVRKSPARNKEGPVKKLAG